MHRFTVSSKKAVLTLLVAAFAAVALAGCVTIQVPASAASSASTADSTSSASTDTGSSSATTTDSSAASSAAASSSAASGPQAVTPSGVEVDVTNDNVGYSFKTDKAFTVTIQDKTVNVCTGADGVAPYFTLLTMQNSSGQSVEELLSGTVQMGLERLGDRVVTKPITNTVQLSNRKMKGIEYTYMDESGTQEYVTLNYAEEINGFFYAWSAVYPVKDTVTPEAMERALDTFHMLAS